MESGFPKKGWIGKKTGGGGGGGGVSHSLGLRVENDVENTCTFEQ